MHRLFPSFAASANRRKAPCQSADRDIKPTARRTNRQFFKFRSHCRRHATVYSPLSAARRKRGAADEWRRVSVQRKSGVRVTVSRSLSRVAGSGVTSGSAGKFLASLPRSGTEAQARLSGFQRIAAALRRQRSANRLGTSRVMADRWSRVGARVAARLRSVAGRAGQPAPDVACRPPGAVLN